MRRRRDTTWIFYDILYRARKGVSKTRIRRELGLTYQCYEERVGFLLARGLLCRQPSEEAVMKLVTTLKGHRLLYFMSMVESELAGFFPSRHEDGSEDWRRAELERGMTELLFNLRRPHPPGEVVQGNA